MADQYLLALALLTTLLFSYPSILMVIYCQTKTTRPSHEAINDGSRHFSAHDYGFVIWLLIPTSAALGGIISLAFRITLYVKDMELGKYEMSPDEWRGSSKMRRIDPDNIWPRAGLLAVLGVLAFGSWIAFCIWPLDR